MPKQPVSKTSPSLTDEQLAALWSLMPQAFSEQSVVHDSEIEKVFVEGLERREDVKLYVKLPGWFTVLTPVGEYNPDWAIVLEPRDEFGKPSGEELLYLVRETKDTTNLDELRMEEARKIRCGERHFRQALGVDYQVVTEAKELNYCFLHK